MRELTNDPRGTADGMQSLTERIAGYIKTAAKNA